MEKYKILIIGYIKKYPQIKSNVELARIILQEEKMDSPHERRLGSYVSEVRSLLADGVIDTLEIEIEEDIPYRVIDGHYRWNISKDKSINLSVEFIDELFYNYSTHGLNLSQTQIINKYNLKTWQWNSIKSRLNLVKLSNVFSPHTVEITPPDQLAQMMEEKMSKKFENVGLQIEQTYNKLLNRQFKKAIESVETNKFLNQYALSELADILPQKMVKVAVLPKMEAKQEAIDHLVISLTDMHVGADVKDLKTTPDYDSTVMYRRLDRVIKEVNQMGAKKVTICFLGDLIETFTGTNHINTWKGIERGVYGARVIANAFEMVEYVITRINNVESVLGVGGNHDRSTSDNKDDVTSEIATAIFYFVNRVFGNKINIEYSSDILVKEIDGINYLLSHGHLGMTKNKAAIRKMFFDYGNNQLYNLFLTGHLHSRHIPDETSKSRWLICPPIFTGNRYSNNAGFDAVGGYLMIYNNGSGVPRVIDDALI